jgi:hypothetical protein
MGVSLSARKVPMTLRVERSNSRVWSDEQMEVLFAEGFPRFITADLDVTEYIGRVREYFPHLDVMMVDESDTPTATGWGVPMTWSGDVADLPSSFAEILRRAIEVHDSGSESNTFVICGAVVDPGRKSSGAAAELIRALISVGRARGMTRVLAPVRPTRKHLYPLFSIEDYASWVRDDGLPFDPWLRLHVRLGAQVISLAREAQTMTGTVKEWEEWTGISMPVSGDYIIPQGMSVLRIDRGADLGTYVEPNIWIQHV